MKEERKNSFLFGFLISAVFAVMIFLVGALRVNAEEIEKYTYTFMYTTDSYKPTDVLVSSKTFDYIIESNSPFDILSFRYVTNNGLSDNIYFYIVPKIQTDKDFKINVSSDGGTTWNNYACSGYLQFDSIRFYYFFSGQIPLLSDNGNGWYSKAVTNLPYMNVSGQDQINEILKDIANDDWSAYKETENLPLTYEFDTNIETPQLVFTDGLKFYINNASDNYYIEIQGRCYSIDDIELYKENLMWKYKYSTIIKNDLSTWVSIDDSISSKGEHDLYVYGESSFANLLSLHPIESRNYFGGTNALGNYFSGYNDALSTLQNVLLPVHGSLFNGSEIYVRFYYVDDNNNVHYGKWCHWFDSLASSSGSSGSQWDDKDNMFTESQSDIGLTDSEKDNLENTGDSQKYDDDAKPSYNNTSSWDSKAGDEVWNIVQSMANSLGDFPALVQRVFSFLPDWLIALIGVGIGFVVILRFLGR